MTAFTNREIVVPDCPIRNILSRFGDKWSMLVLYTLECRGTMRYSEIARSIPDISQKMLTTTLRTLGQDGLVARKLYTEVPPRVEYSLTQRSQSLMPHLDSLIQWALDNSAAILNDRTHASVAQ